MKKEKKGKEEIFEAIMIENFPQINIRHQTTHPGSTESPIQDKSKEKHTKTHINQTIKIKNKEKILKAARKKQQITHKGIPIRLTADLSTESLQARREWQDIFKVMKEKNLQP